MKKLILIILSLIFPFTLHASGKMIVAVNEQVILTAETDVKMAEFKWNVLKEDKTILSTTTGKSFSYSFKESGNYNINLIVTSTQSDVVENQTIEILVGNSQGFVDSLNINLQAFPNLTDDNKIVLASDNLNTGFILSSSVGNIREYKIDADIKKDADNDGILDNDIDNLNHASFQNGELWIYEYKITDLPTQALINLVDDNGQKVEKKIDIILSAAPLKSQKLKAALEVFPKTAEDGRVILTGDKAKITLFTGNSTGDILEYRIDTNTNYDSDNDGKKDNDIDNLSHNSFTKGGYFETEIKRTDGDIGMQLIVVSSEGKGSKIQKNFVWEIDRGLEKKQDFRVFADNTEVFIGDKVNFGLDGFVSSDDYEIKWDFNNDKSTDVTSNSNLASFVYDKASEFEVLVQVKNQKLNILKYGKINILVKEKSVNNAKTKDPVADFSSDIDNNTVSFTNKSTVDNNLIDKKVKFEWKFGDGNTSSEENPIHIYSEAKKYKVRLLVTDSVEKTNDTNQLIEIEKVTTVPISETPINEDPTNTNDPNNETPVTEDPTNINDPNNNNTENPTESNPETPVPSEPTGGMSILKIIMWAVIALFGGIFVLILGYLLFLKAKNPNYSFAEIIEEEKEKILSTLEGQEYEPPHGEIIATGKKVHDGISEVLDKTNVVKPKVETPPKTEDVKPKVEVSKAEDIKPKVETPLKTESLKDNVVKDKVEVAKPENIKPKVETPKTDNVKTNPVPAPKNSSQKENEDIPDWLKGNVQPATNKTTPIVSSSSAPVSPMPNISTMPPIVSSSSAPVSPMPNISIMPPIAPTNMPPVPPNLPNNANTPDWLKAPDNNDDDDDDIPDWLK